MKQPTLATSVVSGVSDEVVDVVADEDVDADMDEDMSMMNMVKVAEGLGVAKPPSDEQQSESAPKRAKHNLTSDASERYGGYENEEEDDEAY
ncbi:hypothetical protein PR002_g1424 [Phytophthora rubi]|uniref:Uncharacterized protein n=1 Tax=Phytophthora rubi TaxID=129364 RepID=A0A6A3NZ65_9STRA|nr:hypothetical protein PR002_g1424 [Phytophthora rubi]